MPAYASLRRAPRKADRLAEQAETAFWSAIDGLYESARIRTEAAEQQAAQAAALVSQARDLQDLAAASRSEADKALARAQRLADLID